MPRILDAVDGICRADAVVVGAGIAGLTAALGLAPRSVTLLTKARLGWGGASVWAQGGVAAAVGTDDSPALHAADTLSAGAGISQVDAVAVLTSEGPARMRELLEIGTRFDLDDTGHLALGREAAHSRRRILHARDATGAEIVRALTAAVVATPAVSAIEGAFALDLVVEDGRVRGLLARHADGRLILHLAPAVILATGGIGQVYLATTNPREATGDGLAMAARAGARLADVEFVQFHPTALAGGRDPMPLLTEALRGEGAVLVDETGHRFMPAEHPDAELAPRDVVARAIWRRLMEGHEVFLDAREAVGEAFPEKFPTVFNLCREQGFDPRVEPIPVAPAAHYHMGGVVTDGLGRTSLPGLWACGEVASTGVHGANRLASNSLLEGLVYAARVAEDVADLQVAGRPLSLRTVAALRTSEAPESQAAETAAVTAAVRKILWERVGLVRDETGLTAALEELEEIARRHPDLGGEAGNLLLVGRLVAGAAVLRRESRGGHFRSDFPEPAPAWQHRSFFTATAGGLLFPETGESQAAVAVPAVAGGVR